MDEWLAQLQQGRPEAAWDLFLARYRRLVFAAIRHYAQDYDDVMDVFARVCEALREDDLRRLRAYTDQTAHRAAFSTWLVTVVRHLTVDWFRQRDGRHRVSALADRLPDLQRRIFQHVFVERRSHVEAFELIRGRDRPDLAFGEFLGELRATYRAVTDGRRGTLPRDLVTVPLSFEVADERPAADAAPPDRELLDRALARLSPDDRLAVQLYVIDELPAADVARIVGLANAKAVYNKVYRALEQLRADLEGQGLGVEDL